MKTMFTMGFAPQQGVFGFGYQLGQDAASLATTMTKADRDKLLGDINRASEEYKAINVWKEANQNWQYILGNDLKAFSDDLTNIEAFSSTALSVQTRLSTAGPTLVITAQEWNDSNTWILLVDHAFKLMRAHAPVPGTAPGLPVPAAQAEKVNPVAIGIGVAAGVALLAVLFG